MIKNELWLNNTCISHLHLHFIFKWLFYFASLDSKGFCSSYANFRRGLISVEYTGLQSQPSKAF